MQALHAVGFVRHGRGGQVDSVRRAVAPIAHALTALGGAHDALTEPLALRPAYFCWDVPGRDCVGGDSLSAPHRAELGRLGAEGRWTPWDTVTSSGEVTTPPSATRDVQRTYSAAVSSGEARHSLVSCWRWAHKAPCAVHAHGFEIEWLAWFVCCSSSALSG
jgi:hypothetical protein